MNSCFEALASKKLSTESPLIVTWSVLLLYSTTSSSSKAEKFSGHRRSAQLRVKKNVKGPRFSNLARSSYLVFFQYFLV